MITNNSSAQTASLQVKGDLLEINGVSQVPPGLFGTHAVPLNETRIREWGIEMDRNLDQNPSGTPRQSPTPMLMECFFDRYQPALILNDRNWEQRLTSIARTYAEGARELDREPIVEFWNEPYLNWAVKPGVNYDGGLYQGPPEPGKPMRTKLSGELIEDLVWDAPRPVAIRGFNPGKGAIDYLATRFMPTDLKAGDTFTWRDKPYTVEDRWWGKDRTQPVSWWSGPVNREYYQRMLKPFATTLKSVNPDVTLVVGWGFHLNESNWQAWHTLHKPLIDFAHEWMDGYNEHHYGGNTRMVAGTYETAYAYTLGAHGKKLKFYNTEAGGMLDPERPGSFNSAVKGSPVEQARGAYTYMVRDVLHLIDTMPDKAITRFAHEAHLHKGGGETAFKLMRTLRGSLIAADVEGDPNIWAVASLNGLDYTVILFNDHYESKTLDLKIESPPGFNLDGGTLSRAADIPDIGMELVTETVPYSEGNSQHLETLELPPKDAVRYHFRLRKQGEATLPKQIKKQFAAPEILQEIEGDAVADFHIELPDFPRDRGITATLRLVHDSDLRWRSKDLRLFLNDTEIPLDVSTDYLFEVALPVEHLQVQNRLRFSLKPEAKPVLLCTASIFLETRQP